MNSAKMDESEFKKTGEKVKVTCRGKTDLKCIHSWRNSHQRWTFSLASSMAWQPAEQLMGPTWGYSGSHRVKATAWVIRAPLLSQVIPLLKPAP